MSGRSTPGPMCCTNGTYLDDGTMCLSLSPTPGPVGTSRMATPVPEDLHRALREFETESTAFATRFIPDHQLRMKYASQIRAMSEGTLADVRAGTVTAEQGQRFAHQMRNKIMEDTRTLSSDVGAAWARKMKASGKDLPVLQQEHATKLFRKEFAALTEAEQGEVFLGVIESSGRPNPGVMGLSLRMARLSKGLIFVTGAVAVYQVATSDRPGREAVKQGTVVGTGVAGAALGGAAGGAVCGPGAPVCAGIFAFVAGAAVACGVDLGFDRLWK